MSPYDCRSIKVSLRKSLSCSIKSLVAMVYDYVELSIFNISLK